MSIAQYDKSTVEELLSTVKQLSSNDLKEFTQQFLAWQKRDIAKEAVLLKAIEEHSRLPDAEQERYEELRHKFDQEILNELEFMEYQSLLQQLEVRNVKRIEALVALAQRRGKTLRGIMVELGLKGESGAL